MGTKLHVLMSSMENNSQHAIVVDILSNIIILMDAFDGFCWFSWVRALKIEPTQTGTHTHTHAPYTYSYWAFGVTSVPEAEPGATLALMSPHLSLPPSYFQSSCSPSQWDHLWFKWLTEAAAAAAAALRHFREKRKHAVYIRQGV